MNIIIFIVILVQFIFYILVKYKFHWLFYFCNKEKDKDKDKDIEESKIINDFITKKDKTIEDCIDELEKYRKKKKKYRILQSRKDKLNKLRW